MIKSFLSATSIAFLVALLTGSSVNDKVPKWNKREPAIKSSSTSSALRLISAPGFL